MEQQIAAFVMLCFIAAYANIRGMQKWMKGENKIMSIIWCFIATIAMLCIYYKLKGWLQ